MANDLPGNQAGSQGSTGHLAKWEVRRRKGKEGRKEMRKAGKGLKTNVDDYKKGCGGGGGKVSLGRGKERKERKDMSKCVCVCVYV